MLTVSKPMSTRSLKGTTSRFDELDQDNPNYPRVEERLGPATSDPRSDRSRTAPCRGPKFWNQCSTMRRCGTRGPARRAGRRAGLRPRW